MGVRDPTLSELFAFRHYNPSLGTALDYLMKTLDAAGLPSDVISVLAQQCTSPEEFARRVQEALNAQSASPSLTLEALEGPNLGETLAYIHDRAMAGVKSGDVGAFHEIAEAVESIEPSLVRSPG